VKILETRNGHPVEVELTSFEMAARDWFHDHLDTDPETQGIQATAQHALSLVPKDCLDPEFVTYLSDGTLTLTDDGVVPTSLSAPN